MELEQRVKVLEQEVKILKNQIQTTLLDIQEQLLVGRYPALRTEDPSAQVAVKPVDPAPTAGAAPAPIVHTVRLAEIPPDPEPALDFAEPESSVTPPAPMRSSGGWDELTRLNDWAITTVEKFGVERAQQLVMVYARRGLFTADVEEALLEAVSLYGGQEVDGHNGHVPVSVEADIAPETEVYAPEDDAPPVRVERNLIMRLIDGLGGGRRQEVNHG